MLPEKSAVLPDFSGVLRDKPECLVAGAESLPNRGRFRGGREEIWKRLPYFSRKYGCRSLFFIKFALQYNKHYL